MRFRCAIVIFFSLTLLSESADLIVYNASVYTVDPKQSTAEAIVVEGGKLMYVGSESGAEAFRKPETSMVDAKGGSVLPGFVEAHVYPALAGVFAEALPLSGLPSERHILWRLEQYLKSNPEAESVLGFGWNPRLFPEGPRKERLDIVAPSVPVILVSADGGSAWLNSRALVLLGIDEHTPQPQEGKHFYHKGADGKLSGWFVGESAIWPHIHSLGLVDEELLKHVLIELLPKFSSAGVTTLYDAGLPAHARELQRVVMRMESEGSLPLRYAYSRVILNQNDVTDALEEFQRLDAQKSEMQWPAAVKLTNDGSIEDQTARLIRPYNGSKNHYGDVLFDRRVLQGLIQEADALGISTHIHTGGDYSVHEALNAIESVREFRSENSPRHTLCHLQLVDRSDIARFGKLGVIAQVSPQWMEDDDGGMYRHWIRVLGITRADRQFPMRSLARSGAVLSMGSAFPVSGLSLLEGTPLYGIQKGITRTSCGEVNAKLLPPKSQAMKLRQMIQAATLNGAYQLGVEKSIGSLEVGKQADFIVLDRNLLESPMEEIHKVRVVQTYVNGDLVYQIDDHGGTVLKE